MCLSLIIVNVQLITSVQLAQLIVNAGGVAAMVDYIGDTCGNIRLPGIMMLGYVGAHSENLAMAVIVSKVSFVLCYYQLLTVFFKVKG